MKSPLSRIVPLLLTIAPLLLTAVIVLLATDYKRVTPSATALRHNSGSRAAQIVAGAELAATPASARRVAGATATRAPLADRLRDRMGSVSATSALGTRTDAHGLTVRVSTVPGATDLRAQMRALRAGQRVRFAGSYFNPTVETLLLEYTVHRAALVTVAVYNAAGGRVNDVVMPGVVPAGELIRISWDGRDDTGKTVPAGRYSVYLRAAAPHGISSVKGWSSIIVSYKRIVVSLWQQRLWAYNGDHLLLTTLVTTGNRLLPTPTGLFHIMFARQNFTFNSPWPVGSPFYYPPSSVHYGLYFHDDGYYLHDAPWRTVFGPGSNATTGIPGQNLTGTHGCVNVPLAAMAQLHRWATPGTVVQINA